MPVIDRGLRMIPNGLPPEFDVGNGRVEFSVPRFGCHRMVELSYKEQGPLPPCCSPHGQTAVSKRSAFFEKDGGPGEWKRGDPERSPLLPDRRQRCRTPPPADPKTADNTATARYNDFFIFHRAFYMDPA